MSADKLKEIQRNLAEQESFVQSIIEQREKKSRPENDANIDNILSSSIQKAKQKINSIDLKSQPPRNDRSSQNLATSRQRKQKSGEQSSAIAGAMKKLQERISNLEQENLRLTSQNQEMKKRELVEADNMETMRRNLDENKRKVKNLEASIEKDKNLIKQLERKNDQLQRQLANKKAQNHKEQLQKKLTTSQMMYRAQQQQFKQIISENQTKERKLMELENKRRQQQIRFTQELKMTNSLCRQLQLKITNLQQKNKQKDLLIQGLKNEVRNMDAQRLKCSTIINNSKFEITQNQLCQDKPINQNRVSRRKALESQIIKDNEIQELKQKYEELFITYKNLDEKNRQQKLEVKNYRNKFWQLKQSVKELIDKIQTLPNGVTSQLKYLIVKINKIEAFSNEYFAATPTKSTRKTSLLNNSTERSRSKSNSKRKQIKLDLNRSNNSAKSKRSSNTNRSTQKKKQTKSKQKQVIVSTKGVKRSEVAELEAEIQEIRKRYKELVMAQSRENQDVSEDLREELNNLAVLLQQKSENLTKLKKKK